MATLTKNALDPFIPELWWNEALLARQENHFMAERVLGVLKDGMKRGDKVHIPSVGNLNVNKVGNDGSFSPQANADPEYVVEVTEWNEASVEITDEAEDEVSFDVMAAKMKKIGHALARDIEDFLLNLYVKLYTNGQYTTEKTNTDEDQLVEGIVMLDNADVPDDDRFVIFRPSQRGALLKQTVFTSRDFVDGRPKTSRVLGDVFGMSVLRSTRVKRADYDSDGVTESVNLMWHLEAFGLALQAKPKVEKMDRTKLATTVVGHQRYGADNIRLDHAVILGTVN